MKVFRNLILRGDDANLAATAEAIERSLTNGWTRSHAAETRVNDTTQRWYCFLNPARPPRPAAELFLAERSRGVWHVPNIVPDGQRDLSYDHYNAILEEFCAEFVRPNAKKHGVNVELTGSVKELEEWMSLDAAQKLRAFSATANRIVGASLSSDREQWLDFVLTVHRGGGQLDSADLKRYLIEDEGWAEEVADRLASEFDFGTKMLTFAESHLQPN